MLDLPSRIGQAIRFRIEGLTYAEIGRQFGVSRQRAQQLVAPSTAMYNAVVRRAKSRCEVCHCELGERRLGKRPGDVHHRYPVSDLKLWNSLDNLELLCKPCHRQSHAAPELK